MTQQNVRFDWNRRWTRLGGVVPIEGGGYLGDPRDFGLAADTLVPLSDLVALPCLILLGEPGIGKSAEIAVRFLGSSRQDAPVFRYDLKSIGSTEDLRRRIFDTPAWVRWRDGDGRALLVLDSLDEALIDLGYLASWLPAQLGEEPLERLSLRIACRTAVWPSTLHAGLQLLWPGDAYAAYELAPLSRADVRLAAAAITNIDADAFLREIATRDVAALASKPTTLLLLLSLMSARGRMPADQLSLYAEGCLQLCRETDAERHESHRAGELTPDLRMAIAARIAAVTVFGNRGAISNAQHVAVVPAPDLSLGALTGDTVTAGGLTAAVTPDAVLETLDTGLFSGRGVGFVGWAHQTYGEYLAARWVTDSGLELPQIEGLVRLGSQPSRPFIPQLYGTIAWLGAMRPDVRNLLGCLEPELLLGTDVPAPPDERRALVTRLIEREDRDELPDPGFARSRRYDRLAYPGLPEQLRSVIIANTRRMKTRQFAIEIAAMSEARELAGTLAEIALNPAEPLRLRVQAAHGVGRLGDQAARARLVPLALATDLAEDRDDELKGAALNAVWPCCITADQLFGALSPRRNPMFIGSYATFQTGVGRNITPEMLRPGLAWAVRQSPDDAFGDDLAAAIYGAAWERVDWPDVLEQLVARMVANAQLGDTPWRGLTRRYRHDDVVPAAIVTAPARRRRLVEAVVRAHPNPNVLVYDFVNGATPLVDQSDLAWLVEHTKSVDPATPSIWSALASAVVIPTLPEHHAIAYPIVFAPPPSSSLATALRPRFVSDLDSEDARAAREREALRQSIAAQRAAASGEPVFFSTDRVLAGLATLGGGDPFGWSQVTQEFLRSADGLRMNEHDLDLWTRPAWAGLDGPTREAVLSGAHQFVLVDRALLGANPSLPVIRRRSTWDGYRAFRLLAAQSPERLDALPVDRWRVWDQPILALMLERPLSVDPVGDVLLRRAYAVGQVLVLDAIFARLRAENERGALFSVDRLEPIWDEEAAGRLVEFCNQPVLHPLSLREVLRVLLEHEDRRGRELAVRWLGHRAVGGSDSGDQPDTYAHATAAGEALLIHAADSGWDLIWPSIQRDIAFGQALIVAVAPSVDRHARTVLERLGETQLGDWFAWMQQQFPDRTAPGTGVGAGLLDTVGDLRSRLIVALQERGTEAAVGVLQDLSERFPELPWLRRVTLDTRQRAHARAWRAPDPASVLALGARRDARLMTGGGDLLAIVRESLGRLNAEFQGETGSARLLWNNEPTVGTRPKDEGDLADEIKRHLNRDLPGRVVAVREVEIRRKNRQREDAGVAAGELTDVYVRAAIGGPDGTAGWAEVIIEVKGSWNDGVLTDMDEQLVQRYLRTSKTCQHGLFVVGWYLCDRWVDEPRRRESAKLGTIEALRSTLDAQADALTTTEHVVRSTVLDVRWL